MRRVVCIVLVILLAACALSGCKRLIPEEKQSISLYATFYPVYALADGVMEGVPDAALHCLVQPQDGCLRAYQLSDWDVSLLSAGADAVIMGGRGLESFESALFGWGDDGPAVSAVLYNLELYNQDDGAGADPESQSHLKGPNPHLYMSLEGAGEIIESLSATMLSLDPKYADTYVKNAEAAKARLDELFKANQEMLADFAGRRVALMNEALIYVVRDYGLEVAEWIDRECGATMSPDVLQATLERLSGMGADVVLIEKQAPATLTDALEAAGFAVARVDVLSTHREGEGFESYLEIQGENARAIREAFERADAGKE